MKSYFDFSAASASSAIARRIVIVEWPSAIAFLSPHSSASCITARKRISFSDPMHHSSPVVKRAKRFPVRAKNTWNSFLTIGSRILSMDSGSIQKNSFDPSARRKEVRILSPSPSHSSKVAISLVDIAKSIRRRVSSDTGMPSVLARCVSFLCCGSVKEIICFFIRPGYPWVSPESR